jgi:hypothetical protein
MTNNLFIVDFNKKKLKKIEKGMCLGLKNWAWVSCQTEKGSAHASLHT